MAQKDKNTLKGYFRTGARPTEAQFADLIDSMALEAEVPTPQSSVNGTNKNYVYSTGHYSLDAVMAVKSTGLLQNNGNLVFSAHVWNPQTDPARPTYFTTPVPKASATADGAMDHDVFNRLGTGASISEGVRGADAVTINYPNWAHGGNRSFPLHAATLTQAGVMTAADKKALDNADRIRKFDFVLIKRANGSYPSPAEAGVATGIDYTQLAILIDQENGENNVAANVAEEWRSIAKISGIVPELQTDDRVVYDSKVHAYRCAPGVIFLIDGNNASAGYYIENQNLPGYVTKIVTETQLYEVANTKANKSEVEAAKVKLFNDQWTAWGGTIANSQYTKFGVAMNYDKAVRVYGMHEFIDKWNEACLGNGKYNAATEYFELNGLTDITYKQAVNIYSAPRISYPNTIGVQYNALARTLILYSATTIGVDADFANMFRDSNYETLRLTNQGYAALRVVALGGCFHNCPKLKHIYGTIDGSQCPHFSYTFNNCFSLVSVQLSKIKASCGFPHSNLLSYDSLNYLVANASNTAAITITVHADVYAKLTGDTTNAAAAALTPEEAVQWQALVTTAADKQISFVKA